MPEPAVQNPPENDDAEPPPQRNHRDPRDPRNHLDGNPLIKPFVVLALPGMYLFYKYNQYKRKRKENATRRLAERELLHLNNKIEKLLSKLEESESELATTQEEECVICIHAKATMQTSPCGHQVVCRKCFVKTIQIAVSQRLLPLRCVICRAKILRLKTGPMLPTSVSGYSVSSRTSSVPQSDSLYSVSSGGSSIISSNSSASERCQHCLKDPRDPGPSKGCGGQCGMRQPITGAIRRSQKREMKMTLQDYHRPEKNHINRLPPIKEMSPLHAPPASTRIRCAQKIVTQLEMPIFNRNHRGQKYERLPLEEDDLDQPSTSQKSVKTPHKTPQKSKFFERENSPEVLNNKVKISTEKYKVLEEKKPENKPLKKWWQDTRRSSKSEERIDNKKNEIMEKQMELKEKINTKMDKLKGKEKTKLISVEDDSL